MTAGIARPSQDRARGTTFAGRIPNKAVPDMTSTLSLLDRAGLDRDAARRHLARGLEGADDGELFLEYRQSEMLAFDNGRLKQATYDTAQGFGLRAVKDEAVGYAHASDLSEAAIARAADAVRAVKGGYSGQLCGGAGAHQRAALRRRQSARRAGLRDQGEAAGDDRRLCARQGPARAAGDRLASARPGRWSRSCAPTATTYRDVRPLVRVNVSVVVGDGDRQESGSYGYGGREGFDAFIDETKLAARGRRGGAPGAGQSRRGAGAGRRDGRRARPRLAGRDAARGGRPRPRRRLQPQEDLGLRRPDGPAGGGEGRHRGRRRHHAEPPRLALDRRRGHADQPHRADRGRHPRRLHAGPPERAADGHGADRQRPARELRPCRRCRA